MSNTNSVLDAMLNQYKETSEKGNKDYNSTPFDLKNYFSTYIEKTVKTAKKQIRILPPQENSDSPFEILYVHNKEVDGTKRKFACLKEMQNKPCPFCETKDLLYSSGEESDKDLAKKYIARKTYVCRVIERGKEDEGVKFWRINHDFRKQGTFDKIMAIVEEKGDITDEKTGRDITIHIGRDQNNNPVVTSITDKDPSVITTDSILLEKIITDKKTWENVYSVKPYEYLEIIIKGGVPMWDKEKNCFIDKGVEETEEKDSENISAELDAELKNDVTDVTASDLGEEDDLPF